MSVRTFATTSDEWQARMKRIKASGAGDFLNVNHDPARATSENYVRNVMGEVGVKSGCSACGEDGRGLSYCYDCGEKT